MFVSMYFISINIRRIYLVKDYCIFEQRGSSDKEMEYCGDLGVMRTGEVAVGENQAIWPLLGHLAFSLQLITPPSYDLGPPLCRPYESHCSNLPKNPGSLQHKTDISPILTSFDMSLYLRRVDRMEADEEGLARGLASF